MTQTHDIPRSANKHVCSLCGELYDGYGNNASPFDGRCCNKCQQHYVLPARLLYMNDPDFYRILVTKLPRASAKGKRHA